MAVVWLQLSVDVLRTISVVLEVLKALAISDIEGLEFDDGAVGTNRLEVWRNVDPVVDPQVVRVCTRDLRAIDGDRSDFLALVVDEEAFRVVSARYVGGRHALQRVVNCDLTVVGCASFDQAKSELVADIEDVGAAVRRLNLRQVMIAVVSGVCESRLQTYSSRSCNLATATFFALFRSVACSRALFLHFLVDAVAGDYECSHTQCSYHDL